MDGVFRVVVAFAREQAHSIGSGAKPGVRCIESARIRPASSSPHFYPNMDNLQYRCYLLDFCYTKMTSKVLDTALLVFHRVLGTSLCLEVPYVAQRKNMG